MRVRVHHNGDDVYIAWKVDAAISQCRGFALHRKRNGVDEIVPTWVGFRGDTHDVGESRPSTEWPIQRYQWTDYLAEPGDTLQYRVVPMVGKRGALTPGDPSEWTPEITLTHEVSPNIEAYFNRGIVASQWVSRRLHITADDLKPAVGTSDHASIELTEVVDTPHAPLRDFLMGGLGDKLFQLLAEVASDGRHIYAALYEFGDPQLEEALGLIGTKAHVVLANGSWKQRKLTDEEKANKVKLPRGDQMRAVRKRLRTRIDLHDRILKQGVLGHNKFMVVCDQSDTPRWVWTGSTNWTKTGLCTQANNAVLIDDARLAADYKAQWDRLVAAKNDTPATLKESNSQSRMETIADAGISLWFTPTLRRVDLAQATALIEAADDAILFLMFNPGPDESSLLGKIITTAMKKPHEKQLYVRGVLNQDPSTTKNPVVLFDGKTRLPSDLSVTLPAAIDVPTKWFVRELTKIAKGRAMVHSKLVVVDPFGEHPIVMTGSHNMGKKASGVNDENLLIIENAPGLAAAYATNVMAVFNQYNWRYNTLHKVTGTTTYDGLKDHAFWQPWFWNFPELQPRRDAKFAEMDFWVGE